MEVSGQEFPTPPLPCLVINYDGAEGEPCTTLLDSKGEYHTCNIAMLRNKWTWITPQGWVLSWDPSDSSTFLWSPRTSEKIELPSLTREIPIWSACSLSDEPTSTAAGCTVVLVEPEDTVMSYCRVGGGGAAAAAAAADGWVRYEYDLGSVTLPLNGTQVKRSITRLTACGGKFYFVKSTVELGVLEFSPHPVLESVVIADMKRPASTESMTQSCLELQRELYLVSAFLRSNRSVIRCGVYKMDFARRRWRRIRSIGDRAFLMCDSYFGGWCPATAGSGLRPNCVYWMGPPPCYNLPHIFDINDGSRVEVHDPCKDIPDPNRNARWVLPTNP